MNKLEILGLCKFLESQGYENTEIISNFIFELQQENKQLKENWNKLKEYLETNWKESQDIWFIKIINKMQELEQGSDSNVKD